MNGLLIAVAIIVMLIASIGIIRDIKTLRKSCKKCKHYGKDENTFPCVYCFEFEEFEEK